MFICYLFMLAHCDVFSDTSQLAPQCKAVPVVVKTRFLSQCHVNKFYKLESRIFWAVLQD